MFTFSSIRSSFCVFLLVALSNTPLWADTCGCEPHTSRYDLDHDGAWTHLDQTLLIHMVLGLEPPTEQADFNQDGSVNVLDILLFLKRITARGYLSGDLNGDNKISVTDVIKVLLIKMEKIPYQKAADMNRDGDVDDCDVHIAVYAALRS